MGQVFLILPPHDSSLLRRRPLAINRASTHTWQGIEKLEEKYFERKHVCFGCM